MDPLTMVLGDRQLGGRENVVTIQCMENHNKMTTKNGLYRFVLRRSYCIEIDPNTDSHWVLF